MDGSELVKQIPPIAKGVAEIIATVPLADIVKRICAPTADLLGEKAKQRIELCFEKTAKIAQDAGFTPQAVPPKLLVPILQGASLEDDEDLHTMWAALLANGASPDQADNVRPGYVALLKQMAPDEASLMNWVYDAADQGTEHNTPTGLIETVGRAFDSEELQLAFYKNGLGKADGTTRAFGSALGSLVAYQLIRRIYEAAVGGKEMYCLTTRGSEFVRACRPPKPKC